MTASAWIAIGSFVAAIAPLYALYINSRKHADDTYEASLERRVDRLERELDSERARSTELAEENLRLMRRILADPRTSPPPP